MKDLILPFRTWAWLIIFIAIIWSGVSTTKVTAKVGQMILSPEVGVNLYIGILKVKKKKKNAKETSTKLKGCDEVYCKIIFQVLGFHGSQS